MKYRVDLVDINLYWSDLTEEAQNEIIRELSNMRIELSPIIMNTINQSHYLRLVNMEIKEG